MKRNTTRIINLGIIVLILAGLFTWPEPVHAGVSEWSAETTPSIAGNVLGPAGIDIRDFAVAGDDRTIYAVPGNSIASHVIFKSIDAGVSWTVISIATQADLIAVAPDNANIVVFANNSTPELQISIDGGAIWATMSKPQAPGGSAASYLTDIAVSPNKGGIRYIAAAGAEAGGIGNLWYFPYGTMGATWQETKSPATGFVSQNEVAAIMFSPNFTSDSTLTAVTDNLSSGIKLQLLNLTSLKWNAPGSYPSYPLTVYGSGITRLESASITLASAFNGFEEDTHTLFIGLTIDGNAAASGIYRFMNTVKTSILTGVQIHSVDFNGTYVVAGQYNSTVIYRIQYPLYSTWVTKTSTATKNPGGDGRVIVAWMGSAVAAGTGGDESAFSISKDYGATFNDISLIDTTITYARDVAVSASGDKVYYVTDDDVDTSVWYQYSGVWTRIFSCRGVKDCIIRAEKQSASYVYLIRKGAATIYYNSSSGAGQWQTLTCILNIQDMVVESYKNIYALDASGNVARSQSNGLNWETPIATGLSTGNTLGFISTGKLLAGSQDGYIAYSLDSNESWTKITQQFGGAAGKMHVAADQNFSYNKTIYAASETAGQNIMKWVIDKSSSWTDIFSGNLAGGIYGLAIDSDTIYALEWDTATNQSTLWHFLTPVNATYLSVEWVSSATTVTTDITDPNVQLGAGPQGLKASKNKLWAIKTSGTNKLYSYNDSVINSKIKLIEPSDRFIGRVNASTGMVYDIGFTWYRVASATDYEVRIATDRNFSQMVATINVASSDNTVFAQIGPNQTGLNYAPLNAGASYYWKVRSTKPGYSPFTDVRVFSIEPFIASSLQLLAPSNGITINDITPAFSWAPLGGATEYEFSLSENITMFPVLVDTKIKSTSIQIEKELTRGKTYFWKVRATNPIRSEWSMIGIFMLEAAPATTLPPPIPTLTTTITYSLPIPTSTEVILPPESNAAKKETPPYLIIALLIGSFLTGTVVLLIAGRPKKLFTNIPVTESQGPARRIRHDAGKNDAGQEKPVLPDRIARPSIPVPDKPAQTSAGKEKPAVEKTPAPPAMSKSKDAEAVIFAAKSFLWMSSQGQGNGEQANLGKKLAARIHDLAKKENLYLRHAEDAAALLQIWARYGSMSETNKYLTESFKEKPENAVSLLKCYLAPGTPPEAKDAAEGFTRDSYKALAEVVENDKVYAALTKVFKFKLDTIEESSAINPIDRNIAFKFMRLHLQNKNSL